MQQPLCHTPNASTKLTPYLTFESMQIPVIHAGCAEVFGPILIYYQLLCVRLVVLRIRILGLLLVYRRWGKGSISLVLAWLNHTTAVTQLAWSRENRVFITYLTMVP
jgi:hypothetical protein